jgi:S1-C subfamily serine protease
LRLLSLPILVLAALLAGSLPSQAAPPPVKQVAPLAPVTPPATAVAPGEAASAPQPVSASARRIYDKSRNELLQIRTLLKQADSQASVGSGFVVSDDGRIITNYHVVSQFALEPERYRLRFSTTDGQEGALELLDIDARHDLAILRPVAADAKLLAGRGALQFRPRTDPLSKGDRIYSMGKPLDVAFSIVEGNYNGLVERSFDPLIYYAGSINAGMSGGPVVDEDGKVVGINVSAMILAQQMSFLVPGPFAEDLYKKSRDAKPITTAVWSRLRDQVMAYQDELTQAFIKQPWRSAGPGRYRLPVPQEDFMRCWGGGSAADSKGLEYQRTQCRMEHALYINGSLQTGYLDVQHENYDGSKLGALRFAKIYSASFRNERMGFSNKVSTAPFCREEFVDRDGLPLRAVVCLSAYRKLEGLYSLSVLVTTVDASTEGALGRFNAPGVSFDNALKLTAHYLDGFSRAVKP